jgi:hypothetical protein
VTDLEQTQDVPQLSAISGVWLVTRFYGFDCGGRIRSGPVNPPGLWFPCDLNRPFEWPRELRRRPWGA